MVKDLNNIPNIEWLQKIAECIHFLAKNPTLPFVFLSAFVAWQAFKSNRHLTRAKHSIDFQTKYHETESLNVAMKEVLAWSRLPGADATLLAGNMQDPVVDHVMELLNTWERAAIAIRRKVYDGDMLYDAYGTSYVWIWAQLSPFVRARQLNKKNPKLYKNAEWLGVSWTRRRLDEEGAL